MTPLETAQAFMATSKVAINFESSSTTFFSADCRYENVGLSKTRGPAEALAFFAGFTRLIPFVTIKVDMLSIAAAAETVMMERVDHLKNANEKTLLTIRLMGVMKVRHGRMYEWRDYFDTAPFAA